MEHVKIIIAHRFNRFLIVGAGNTTINFAVLNALTIGLHINKMLSAIIATSCAIMFSYALNASFVFGDSKRQLRRLATFSLIAVAGVLLVQTSVYAVSLVLLDRTGHVRSDGAKVNLANLIASVCVMFWNYNGYRLFIFNAKPAIRQDYEA
jgi:putative flippase GtrA